jgi:histidine kinase
MKFWTRFIWCMREFGWCMRQLRWRIVLAQMTVVLVGVVVLAVTAQIIATRTLAPALLDTFQSAMFTALLVAALAAILAGLATSLLLLRAILRPLHQLAHSSQRVAAGHYDERVLVPDSEELAAVASSFNHMAETLEQVEQQRVALIGNVAHELRTPLTGLEGYLEGLVDGVFPGDPETFSSMQHEVRRLRRLVSDLQSLSRVEAGQVALNLTTFDLYELAQRVFAQIQPQIIAQQLDLEIECPPCPLAVSADPDRTSQVLLNLVGNAVRYTPEGGCITIRMAAEGDTALVEVADTGIGIPAEALPYVFERFYRVDPSRARSSGGSGIGLTITRHLVWAMGGDICVSSAGAGEGSTFSFTLPLAGEA